MIPGRRWKMMNTCVCVCVCSSLRCGIDDTAQYTAVAANSHGQASSQAAVIVKSKYILRQAIRISYSKII